MTDQHDQQYFRIANLLLVGNGAALLVIFNARAQGGLAPSAELTQVASLFAFGLVAAFLLIFVAMRHDTVADEPLRLGQTIADRARDQKNRNDWTGYWFLAAAGAFVIGLWLSIGFLNTTPTTPERSPAEQASS